MPENEISAGELIHNTFSTLISCQQKLSYQLSKKLKEFNLTKQQYEVLYILQKHHSETINLNGVKEQMPENMPDISRIVQRMIDKGLLLRETHPTDRRNSAILMTNKGRKMLKEVIPVINSCMASYFDILKPEELLELGRIIKKVNENNTEQ